MEWLKQIAPTIATALGGPLAGMAVSAVSKAIGGAKFSQHIKGQAIDIDADIFSNGLTNKMIFEWLKDMEQGKRKKLRYNLLSSRLMFKGCNFLLIFLARRSSNT